MKVPVVRLAILYFLILAFTFPTIVYVFVVGGVLPLAGYVEFIFRGNQVFAIHALIYIPIFMWLSMKLAKASFIDQQLRKPRIASIIGILVAIGFLKIHGFGHNVIELRNAYQAITGLAGDTDH